MPVSSPTMLLRIALTKLSPAAYMLPRAPPDAPSHGVPPSRRRWSPGVAAARDRARFWHRLWVSCGRPTLSAVSQCYQAARSEYRRPSTSSSVADWVRPTLFDCSAVTKLTTYWRRVQHIPRSEIKSTYDRCAAAFRDHFQTVHCDSHSQLTPAQLQLVAEYVEFRLRSARDDVSNRTVSAGHVTFLSFSVVRHLMQTASRLSPPQNMTGVLLCPDTDCIDDRRSPALHGHSRRLLYALRLDIKQSALGDSE